MRCVRTHHPNPTTNARGPCRRGRARKTARPRAPPERSHPASSLLVHLQEDGPSVAPLQNRSPRGARVSTEFPRRRPRRRRDSSPRNIHVAAAASPRLVSMGYSLRSHGVAATRLLGISTRLRAGTTRISTSRRRRSRASRTCSRPVKPWTRNAARRGARTSRNDDGRRTTWTTARWSNAWAR